MQVGELVVETGALGAAGVDVLDEFGVGFFDELEVSQQPPGPGLVVGDRAAGGGDLPLAVQPGGVVELAEAGVQEVLAVGAEDPGGEEF